MRILLTGTSILLALGFYIAIKDSSSIEPMVEDTNIKKHTAQINLNANTMNSAPSVNQVAVAKSAPVFLKEENHGVSLTDIYDGYDHDEFIHSLNEQELKDITTIPNKFLNVVFDTPHIDSMAEALHKAGYTPVKEKRGHPKTGLRQVLTLNEVKDETGLIREYYSSYLESGNTLYFDRLYYGMAAKDGVFANLVSSMDEKLSEKATNKIVKPEYVRWNLPGGKFVFISSEQERNGEKMVLVGHEYEIH